MGQDHVQHVQAEGHGALGIALVPQCRLDFDQTLGDLGGNGWPWLIAVVLGLFLLLLEQDEAAAPAAEAREAASDHRRRGGVGRVHFGLSLPHASNVEQASPPWQARVNHVWRHLFVYWAIELSWRQ